MAGFDPFASFNPQVLDSSGLGNSSGDGGFFGLLQALLGGGAAGLLQQPANTTGSSSSSGTQSNAVNSSTQRTLLPQQTTLLSPLFSSITAAMTNPSSVTAPYQNQARNQVNDNYSGLADNLRKQFLSTGGGTSGKYGLALAGANTRRLSDLSGVDNSFAERNASLPLETAGLAENLLGMNFGSTSSSGGTSTSNSNTQSQQKTSAGNPLLTGIGTFLGLL